MIVKSRAPFAEVSRDTEPTFRSSVQCSMSKPIIAIIKVNSLDDKIKINENVNMHSVES